MRGVFSGDGHGCAKFAGLGENIGVKECLANDAHSDVGHLPIDINDATISPGLLNLLAIMSHDASIAGNMTWLERWSHEFTLVTMEITFATEDAIADYWTKGIMDGYALIKVIGMLDKNAVDVLWSVEQDAGERSKMHATDVAFARHTS